MWKELTREQTEKVEELTGFRLDRKNPHEAVFVLDYVVDLEGQEYSNSVYLTINTYVTDQNITFTFDGDHDFDEEFKIPFRWLKGLWDILELGRDKPEPEWELGYYPSEDDIY